MHRLGATILCWPAEDSSKPVELSSRNVGQAVRLSIGTKGGGARRGYGVKLSRPGPVTAPTCGRHRTYRT
jgi:hypothetical protein